MSGVRWLWLCTETARLQLCDFLDRCARSLLDADPWRNAAVARSELGWHLSGWERLLRDSACRLARIQCMPVGDLYRDASDRAVTQTDSWTGQCARLLHSAGVQEWQSWQTPGVSLKDYRLYVSQTLKDNGHAVWLAAVQRHNAQVPYCTFQDNMCTAMHQLRRCQLTWDQQLCVRSWCRLRAGLVVLRHLGGRVSEARHQNCVFCDICVRNATVHCLCKCDSFLESRKEIVSVASWHFVSTDELARNILSCQPGAAVFGEVLLMASQIDRKAEEFWASH